MALDPTSHRSRNKCCDQDGPLPRIEEIRISVASLTRVLVTDPQNGNEYIALERRATAFERGTEFVVTTNSQPFGGAVRIKDLEALRVRIGDYQFDTPQSENKRDFRIINHVQNWNAVKELCRESFSRSNIDIVDCDPFPELQEEFYDSLKVKFDRSAFDIRDTGTVLVENKTDSTDNVNVEGMPTRRVYGLSEAIFRDPDVAAKIINSASCITDEEFKALAVQDLANGGRGYANGVRLINKQDLELFYASLDPMNRNQEVRFGEFQLAGNVSAILESRAAKFSVLS